MREFWNWQLAQQAEAIDRLNQAALVAWQVERVRLLSMKPDGRFKLPALDTLLVDAAKPRRQTPQQQRAILHQISAQLGIPLTRRGDHGRSSPRRGRGAQGGESGLAAASRVRAR